MNISIETITPGMAQDYLKRNVNNFRTPDKNRVSRYAKDMERGAWDFTGDTIKFNGDSLLDGQHRLMACVKSGKPFTTVVVRGAQESFNVDRGRPRSIGQWLKHEGIKNANNIAAIARQALLYEQHGIVSGSDSITIGITDKDVIDFAVKHNDALQAAHQLATKQSICINSCLAAVLYSGSGERLATENKTCVWFAESLASGANLGEDEPVSRLRNSLIRHRAASKVPTNIQKQMIVKAWNLTVEGKSCKQLLVRLTGPAKTRPATEILVAHTQLDVD